MAILLGKGIDMFRVISEKDVIEYADNYIGNYLFDRLTDNERFAIGTISAHSLYQNRPYWHDDSAAIEAIRKAFEIVPGVPEDIIIYRGGCLKDRKYYRQYYSASFSKDTAMGYAKSNNVYNPLKLHSIHVTRGAKILPLCSVRKTVGRDAEYEIVIDDSKIRNYFFYIKYVK